MDQNKTELLGMNIAQLEGFMSNIGQPQFRGRQVYKWIYQKEVSSFYDMSDLPKPLRQKLDSIAKISIPRVLKQRLAKDGTRKFLLELEDKKKIETVVISNSDSDSNRFSLCISTQVGCPVNCAFCATGASGFQRNLKAYEIVGQLLGSKKELKKRLKKYEEPLITNVVYMGMGEPLLNYEATIESLLIFNEPKGINIGQRHITISTSGEARGIERLAREQLQITLAVSLHACDDELRNQLVPMNKKYPLKELIKAIEHFISLTNRRVTLEYTMFDDVNISRRDADKLITIAKPLLCNINLIPYNEVEGLPFKKPSLKKVKQFHNWLCEGGLNATIREEKGCEIEAACGQLSLEFNKKKAVAKTGGTGKSKI